MLVWLRDLTARERRTMLACWGGWTLDGFDQQLYSYVVMIGAVFMTAIGFATAVMPRGRAIASLEADAPNAAYPPRSAM